MADSSDDYEWIIYLVVAFFMFVLPLLKKAADAVAGRKKGERQRGRPAGGEDKRGVLGEMLDEVEDYVRKAREEEPVSKPKKKEVAPFDIWYQERKREIERKREQREERRRKRRLEVVEEVEQPVAAEPEPLEIPVSQPAPELLSWNGVAETSVAEGAQESEIGYTPVAEYVQAESPETEDDLAGELLGGIPGVAGAIILGEILSAPKFAESTG